MRQQAVLAWDFDVVSTMIYPSLFTMAPHPPQHKNCIAASHLPAYLPAYLPA
jgi:hypothetical protein